MLVTRSHIIDTRSPISEAMENIFSVENVDSCLTRENLTNICRLCLQLAKYSINIFDRVDPNPNKKPLKDRIFEMYAIKVQYSHGKLPISYLQIRENNFFLREDIFFSYDIRLVSPLSADRTSHYNHFATVAFTLTFSNLSLGFSIYESRFQKPRPK